MWLSGASGAEVSHQATQHRPTRPLTPSARSTGKHAPRAGANSASRKPGKHGSKDSQAHLRGPRGQQAIAAERARNIQAALIREHYLDGEPSGVWDQRSKDAMIRFQHDNGWQNRVTPDSRALIKLGLGPSHEGLLNPDSAALSSAHELGVEREIPGGSIAH
jgi:hypothetical protein